MIKFDNYEIFRNKSETLKEISKDFSDLSAIAYMTDSEIEAINFDKVKTEYANDLGLSEECAYSVDTLAFLNDQNVFIEFKNGNMKNEKSKVKHKIRDSVLILCDILGWTISDTRDKLTFILVYNEAKNSSAKQQIKKHYMKKADEELILYDLGKFKNLYFKDVHTFNEQQFEEYMQNQ